jgi:pimeloyl-ACP methyl ester carboxylesterase
MRIFLGWVLLLLALLSPSLAWAATVPYEITPGIIGRPTIGGQVFFTQTLNVNYQSGQIVLAASPDGVNWTFVDDQADFFITHPDGSTSNFEKPYFFTCAFAAASQPIDLTHLFHPGNNQVQVTLKDVCGGFVGSSPLYLVNLNGPSPTPSPTPSPSPTPPSKTPLILIPGIGGSELKVAEDTFWNEDDGHGGTFNHAYPKDEVVWVNEGEAIKPGEDDYFDILRMKVDGITSEANLDLTGNLLGRAYQPLIDFFINSGYELNKTLFVFPYDWRKDISLTASLLDQKIEDIKIQSGSLKVDILAHSMGGLVSRNYIADPNKASKVRKLFTLGTPHLGSVKFLKTIQYGDCLVLEVGPVCLSIAPSEVMDVIQNTISGFQLAPSQMYFNFYDESENIYPFPYKDDRDIDSNGITGSLNYDRLKELLANLGYNTNLFIPSEALHELDSSLSNVHGVNIYIIAGSGKPTLGQIIEKYALNFGNIKVPEKDFLMINGDETVPLLSASLEDLDRNISVNGDAKNFYTKQKHGELVDDGPALKLVSNLLNENEELPEDTNTKPYKLEGKQLSVHSPVNIHIYDQQGNHTGPTLDGDFEINIPGSTYETLDDAKFIWLPDEGIYNIVFEATNKGGFDFKIRNFENDLNNQTILYDNIPLEVSSTGQTVFDTTGSPPILEVDGNTYSHFSILEGEANYDHTAPTISFSTDKNTLWPPNGKMVNVNIRGNINEENPYITKITVDDEYDEIEPTAEIYYEAEINQHIKLEAKRKGDDKDGRVYKINILVKDLAGNEAQQQLEIIVFHDQR